MQAFYFIVHLGTGGAIGHIEFEKFIHFFQIETDWHLVLLAGVLATNSDGVHIFGE